MRPLPLIAAALAATLSQPVPAPAAEPATDRQIVHVLDRVAFGPTAEDVRHVEAVGIERYIAEQLDPAAIAEAPALNERLAALQTLALNPIQLFRQYGPPRPAGGVRPTPEEIEARRRAARIVLEQASEARLVRALYSRRQLNEVMVDFWFNHFNVFAGKGLDRLWVGAYEEQAIRPHALGRFRDLLLATARHPAMLFYLDNAQNSAAGSKLPNGRDGGLNENYARELMELHTLGIDGGYTQDDVVALARILTGWGLARPGVRPPDDSGFLFDASRHDTGPKRLLGRDVAGGGEAEGLEAIDMLARHPATARHIAFKLAQHFVADAPPAALVERLARRFADSDGDIRAVLQVLFASREFRASVGGKYKTPYRYILSAARAAGTPADNPRPLLNAMARLGMPLYLCQTPDGYPDTADKWVSPDATVVRVGFAVALAAGDLPTGAAPPSPEEGIGMAVSPPAVQAAVPRGRRTEPVDAAALARLLAASLSPATRAAVAAAAPEQRAALMLGGPDFMRR